MATDGLLLSIGSNRTPLRKGLMMEAFKINRGTVSKSKASKPKASPSHKRKLSKGDKIRAGSFFALAVCGLAVSLPHLSDEIGLLTGSLAFASWLVAVVIDLGMVATKAHLSAQGPSKTVAWTVLGSCTLVSIVLNCHAFHTHATVGFGQVAAIGFGVFLPLFNLALSYLGSEILLGKK
jgi:hypothetical protein